MLRTVIAPAVVAASVLWSLPSSAQVSAFPSSDLLCYYIDTVGQTVDLTSICGGSAPFQNLRLSSISNSFESTEPLTQENWDYKKVMAAAGYRLALGNKAFEDVTYDVWDHGDGSFLYFIWRQGAQGDRSNPQVVVEMQDRNALTFNDGYAQGCYYSSGSTCTGNLIDKSARMTAGKKQRIDEALRSIPNHQRWENYRGSCLFPWQLDTAGNRCGARAALVRPGGY